MAKIYISSTYEDLKDEREAAAKAVRRLGHQPVYMEDYVAGPQRPVEKCLQDVRTCDAYVGIFALRYGFIPDGYDKSITHLEYEAAKKNGIPCLLFLLDDNAKWLIKYVSTGEERNKADQLRSELKKERTVSFFKNADELSGLVSVAVSGLILIWERSFIKFIRPEELIGKQLGKYVILEKLGRGGKGLVLKVFDQLEGKEKAIKMVPPRVSDSHLAFKHLQREVNIATSINHPNVVKVLGLEEIDGHFFIIMEYIEGKNLEQMLADSKAGKLKEEQVLDLMQKLARGLLETHKNNVIHRDIKPANIMVTPGGHLKILDFGISYQVTKSMTELVGEHQWQGTWHYMAPEQLSTRYGRENNQVDIWGFGVTMYQLLSGEFPFTNKDQIKDINEKPYELEGTSSETKNIVMKCLEKGRKNRFKEIEEVLNALQALSNKLREALLDKKIKPVDPDPSPGKPMPDAGKDLKEADFGDGIIMIYISPGKFEMVSNDFDSKKLTHEVYLDGYRIGKYEVTIKQYMKFVNETKSHYPEWLEEGSQYHIKTGGDDYYKKLVSDENFPILGISWEDACAYCDWLSKKTGLNFNLPTEVRWEKAARGNDSRQYPWGNRGPDPILANFGDNIGKTTPVGAYPEGASPYGLSDMAGNVWEWCSDWYGPYNTYYKKNPIGPVSGTMRVVRGGSWYSDAGRMRCAVRDGVDPSNRSCYVGFRLCQDNK
jgi:serine/threonine-protein kinase